MSKLYIEKRYGQIPNDILNNPNLSLRAKGIWVFLQAKPDGWHFSVKRISTQTKDGKSAITNALKELEKFWFLRREPRKNEKGRWIGYDYILSEKPFTENPSTEKPSTENYVTLSKKEVVKINNISENYNNQSNQSISDVDNQNKQTQSQAKNIVEANHPKPRIMAVNKPRVKNKGNNIEQIVEDTINYLNSKTERHFRYQTYIDIISARLREGYTVQDFKTVIDNKVTEWVGTNMEKYLTPNTLFSKSHFDTYLNQNISKPKIGGSLWEVVI